MPTWLLGLKGMGIAALCGALLSSGATWRVMSWREQAQKVQTITRTITKIQYRDRVTERVVTKYIVRREQIAEETRNRIEEVETHVTPQADATCNVSVGFVRVWNDAVHGPVPDSAAGVDDTPSGLACSDIAKAFVEAAGRYDTTAGQLIALQEWVNEQRAVKP